jgi:hypothetical protein
MPAALVRRTPTATAIARSDGVTHQAATAITEPETFDADPYLDMHEYDVEWG